MDYSPDQIKYMQMLQEQGVEIHSYTIQLSCTNCPWACLKDVRTPDLSYYRNEEVYRCPLCRETSVRCKIERSV